MVEVTADASRHLFERPVASQPRKATQIGYCTVRIRDNIGMYDFPKCGRKPLASRGPGSRLIAVRSGFEVIRAVAFLKTYFKGPEADGAHSIIPQTPTPVISPASCSYPVGQAITIPDSDPHATIHYTTDGSIPTLKSNWYREPLLLTGSETMNAIAISSLQIGLQELGLPAFPVHEGHVHPVTFILGHESSVWRI